MLMSKIPVSKMFFILHQSLRISIFFQVPLNILTHGLAFHPELAVNPQHPYIPDAYPIIREMVQQRASVLLEASESNDLGVFLSTVKKNFECCKNLEMLPFIWLSNSYFLKGTSHGGLVR